MKHYLRIILEWCWVVLGVVLRRPARYPAGGAAVTVPDANDAIDNRRDIRQLPSTYG